MNSRSVLAAVLGALFLAGAPALSQSVDLRLNTRVAAPRDPVVATVSFLYDGCDFIDVTRTRVEGNRVLLDAVIQTVPVTCIPIAAALNHESIVLPSLPVGDYTVEVVVEGTRGDSVPLQIRERTELLLRDYRFKVEVTWDDPRAGTGQGKAVPLTEESGGFWFFDEENLEVTVKILDGRPVNGHFWVFLASMTDVGFTLKVTWLDHPCLDDLVDPLPDPNCAVRTYRQAPGRNRNVLDVEAFPAEEG
jgi:hypothetical protein